MTDSLWNWTLSEFRTQTASVRATPGGGSVCAVSASFGLGLVIMALEITHKRAQRPALSAAIAEARGILTELGESADEDVRAFEGYMLATKLPQVTGEEKQARELALRRAAGVASDVPLASAKRAVRASSRPTRPRPRARTSSAMSKPALSYCTPPCSASSRRSP